MAHWTALLSQRSYFTGARSVSAQHGPNTSRWQRFKQFFTGTPSLRDAWQQLKGEHPEWELQSTDGVLMRMLSYEEDPRTMNAFVQGVQTIMRNRGVVDKSTVPLLVTCSVGGMGKTEFINHLFRTNDVSRRSQGAHRSCHQVDEFRDGQIRRRDVEGRR